LSSSRELIYTHTHTHTHTRTHTSIAVAAYLAIILTIISILTYSGVRSVALNSFFLEIFFWLEHFLIYL
jgi:hypothetical protein